MGSFRSFASSRILVVSNIFLVPSTKWNTECAIPTFEKSQVFAKWPNYSNHHLLHLMSRTPSGSDLKFRFYIPFRGPDFSMADFPALSFTAPKECACVAGQKLLVLRSCKRVEKDRIWRRRTPTMWKPGLVTDKRGTRGGPCRVWKLDKKTRLILKTRHLFFFQRKCSGVSSCYVLVSIFKNTCQGFDMSRCAQLKWGLAPRLWHSLTLHQWHRHLGTTRGSGMPSNPGNHRDDAVFFSFFTFTNSTVIPSVLAGPKL